ncbi:dihydrodipicolinate synthase family protein [Halorhabdus amylolytica]|uniref:dihydrodipicolinate synthase family protein n=1 Tax=Halorhabdus amylolytica TaxID=2559573 RepID=UPI0010AA5199|nr:dihydrodipicolinate synthase family protein [Halorhabdus amylolytica]
MPEHAPASGEVDPLDLHGVIPPTLTAFDRNENVDYEGTAAQAEFVVDRGVHAVFPLGTNGEFPLLSGDERERIVETVVDAVGDEVPVIAGVGAPGTRETVEHAERAARAGADGLVVVTPYYFPLDHRGAVEHYRQVAAAVDRPIYAYHIPQRTGNTLGAETMREIAAIDGVAGLKDTSEDVPWLGRAMADSPDLTYLAGSNALLYTGLEIGCSGTVSSVANAFPELVVDLYEAFDDGDEERAQQLQRQVLDVLAAFDRGPYMAAVKTALALRDVDIEPGPLRSPLRRLDDEETAALKEDLKELDLL